MKKPLAVIGIAILALALSGCAKAKPKSEQWEIAGKKVTIEYAIPDAKGQARFRDVAPFGAVWTGWSATLKTEIPVWFGTRPASRVGPGEYRLFFQPESAEKLHILVCKNQEHYGKDIELFRAPGPMDAAPSGQAQAEMRVTLRHLTRVPGAEMFDLGLQWLDAEYHATIVFGEVAQE